MKDKTIIANFYPYLEHSDLHHINIEYEEGFESLLKDAGVGAVL